MDLPLSTRVAHQAEAALKSGSTYVVIAVAAIAGIWLDLGDAQQQAILSALPFLKGWGVILTPLAVWLVARLKPSDQASPQTKALIEEIARLRLNEFLKSKGQPTVAVPVVATVDIPPPPPIPPAAAPDPLPPAIVDMLASVKGGTPAPVPDPTRDGTWDVGSFSGNDLRSLTRAILPPGVDSKTADAVLRKWLANLPKS